jgi:drug/metabolite transporter (DMT)-like permease
LNRSFAYYFLVISTLLWGSGYVVAAIPIREVTPLVAAFIRHGIIGVGSLGVLLFFRSQWKKLLLTDHIILMITGICLGIYNWLYLEGIKYSAVMDGVFIESAFVPILTILILFWMKTRITRNQLIGVIIAIMGSCFFFTLSSNYILLVLHA